jgi:hypothetical protein
MLSVGFPREREEKTVGTARPKNRKALRDIVSYEEFGKAPK